MEKICYIVEATTPGVPAYTLEDLKRKQDEMIDVVNMLIEVHPNMEKKLANKVAFEEAFRNAPK